MQSVLTGRSDTTGHQTKAPARTNRMIPQVTAGDLHHSGSSPSLCLYCSVPERGALSQLAAEWMDAEEEGGEGGEGEVNEIPMRCQGVLAVRCRE